MTSLKDWWLQKSIASCYSVFEKTIQRIQKIKEQLALRIVSTEEEIYGVKETQRQANEQFEQTISQKSEKIDEFRQQKEKLSKFEGKLKDIVN